MPSSKIKPEDTPKAKEILLKIEEGKILVKKITTEALATPTSEELVKDKINSVLKSCKDFLSDYGTNYQDLIKSSYNGLRSLANRCLNEVQSFFKNNKDNLLARNLAQAFAKSDKPKKTVNRTFVINGGEATLEEDMSVKFKETSGEFGYDQMIIDDYQARVKEAINTISKQTLTEKTYREVNGRKVGAPVFVSIRNKAEMAVRYDAMKEELKELVASKEQYVIVSQHADASLRCSPLQGLLYKLDVNPEEHVKVVLSSKELGSKKPKEIGKVDGNPYYSLKEAMSYGLFSYNCRHRFIKYIPGQKITPQYQYDSKASEAKREIDTNMRTLERQIRMLKEREVLSLDPKERRLFQKTSKMHYERYCKYAKSHGRVINDWRCSITQSERSYNKSIYRTNGYMPLISPNASEESLEKIIIEEYKKDNILKCDAPSYDELKKNMQKTLSPEQVEEAIHHLKRWTANDDGEDSCRSINKALYDGKVIIGSVNEKSVNNLKLAIENSGYKTKKGQILYRSDFHNLNEMLKGEYLKIENGAIEVNKALYENRGFISCTNDIKSAINYARDKFEDGMQRNVASPRVIFRIKTDKDIPFVPCEGITLTKGDNEQLFMDGRSFTLKSIDKLTKMYIIINVEIHK